MASVDPFISPAELFAWANRNVNDVKSALDSFNERRPYTYFVEPDTEPGQYVHKVRLSEPIPREIALLTFDVVNELRAALDHSIFASGCVLLNREPMGTKFPFGDDEASARRDATRKGSEADPAIVETALSFQPYDAGDRLLFRLNKLRNMKHHRMLAPVLVRAAGINISDSKFVSSGPFAALSMNNAVEWDAAKNELTVFRSGTPDPDNKIEITVGIAFAQGTPFPHADALDVLYTLLRKIQGVLMAIEAETLRLAKERNL